MNSRILPENMQRDRLVFLLQVLQDLGAQAGSPKFRQKSQVHQIQTGLGFVSHQHTGRLIIREDHFCYRTGKGLTILSIPQVELHPQECFLLFQRPIDQGQLIQAGAGIDQENKCLVTGLFQR